MPIEFTLEDIETKYVLEGKRVVPCRELLKWAVWMEKADRSVAKDTIDGIRISTVFIGINHNFGGSGPPLVFETMVFGGEDFVLDEAMNRYSTWDEAERGHHKMCERVHKECNRTRMRRPKRKAP